MRASPLRHPAVAGRFYPDEPTVLARNLDTYLKPDPAPDEEVSGALGCVVPHAGYMYSGHVAGAVYRRLPARSSYIILCPNHFGRGAPLAILSSGGWLTPLGVAPVDAPLARAVAKACALLTEDAEAHEGEHSLEVQLPFLQRQLKEFSFVPISIGVGGYAPLEALGHAIADAARQREPSPLVIASSDMNHYEPDSVTRVKDRKAIDRILALDSRGLYDVVHREDISMCGYGPAVSMLTAVKDMGARRAELVKYATSADAGGDPSGVVGYAGIIVC